MGAADGICSPPPPPPPSARELMFAAWRDAMGDKTLRLEYPLNPQSVVFDIGGYEGQWASDIFSRYLCRIHVFEPQPDKADAIARRFAENNLIKLHKVALGAASGQLELTIDGDASSLYLLGERRTLVRVSTLEEIFAAENIAEIALMKINIEGAEYDLLDHLTSTGLVRRICHIQVQFHDFMPDAEARMHEIQQRLRRTHRTTYQYPFVWESWGRLEPTPSP